MVYFHLHTGGVARLSALCFISSRNFLVIINSYRSNPSLLDSLDRKILARIFLSNLSPSFVAARASILLFFLRSNLVHNPRMTMLISP